MSSTNQGKQAQNAAAFNHGMEMLVGGDAKSKYREQGRYREGTKYGPRYSVGASSSIPTGGGASIPPGPKPPTYRDRDECQVCDPWVTGQTGAAHGRRVYYAAGQYSCAIRPPRCDCHVIGGNTLNSTDFPTGIASGGFGTVTLDSGDADFFVPYFMHVIALEVGSTSSLAITGAPRLVLMQDSKSGQKPNMRRASQTDPAFGVPTLVYGNEKQLECVDWNKFSSINRQQLVVTFFNPATVGVHVFVNLWGLIAGG